MRFNYPLHPELVLDLRGSSHMRQLYRELIPLCEFKNLQLTLNEANIKTGYQRDMYPLMTKDDIFVQHLFLCKKFKESKEKKVYHVGSDIAKEFSKLEKDIPIDIIPKSFMGYISFAPKTIFDEEGWCSGAYVFIGPHTEAFKPVSSNEEELKHPMIWLCYHVRTNLEDETGAISVLTMPLTSEVKNILSPEAYTMKDFIGDRMINISPEVQKKRNVVFRTIINTLIYIFSEEPMLELSRPIKQTGLSNKETMRRGQVINECTLPVTFVYRDFHGVKHTIDKTLVSGHMRWQRCGPQYSGVKLIWINPHERTFKKEERDL